MIKLEGEDQDLFFFYMGMVLMATTDTEFRISILKFVNRVGSQAENFVPYRIKE